MLDNLFLATGFIASIVVAGKEPKTGSLMSYEYVEN